MWENKQFKVLLVFIFQIPLRGHDKLHTIFLYENYNDLILALVIAISFSIFYNVTSLT